MALQVADDIFSIRSEEGVSAPSRCASIIGSNRNSASRLLLKLSCESPSTRRRSPKKANRMMVEKGVGTTNMRPERMATTLETPTKRAVRSMQQEPLRVPACDSEPKARKSLQLTLASSQTSFYDGDDELKEIFEKMDDQEVEELLGPISEKSRTTSTSSDTSGSSPPTTMSESSVSTSESSTIEKSERRRKRNDSVEDDYPSRRAKPCARRQDGGDIILKEPNQKDSGFRPCAGPITVSAAHQRTRKPERPIPRSMRDPGHSAPMIGTSKVAVSTVGVVSSKESSVASTTAQVKVDGVARADAIVDVSKSISVEVLKTTSTTSLSREKAAQHDATMFAKAVKPLSSSVTREKACDVQLPPIIIAHNERKQKLLDLEGIAKGTQYEIARGITHGWWTWDDITEGKVKQLRGTNFEKAGKVAEIIAGGTKERLSQSVVATRQLIYAELDREQDAFLENKGRGLGLMGPWKGKENWYGGCVQLTGKLEFYKDTEKDGLPFAVRLNNFRIGKSNRAARRVTSLSILQLKVDEDALYDQKRQGRVQELLRRGVVICGRRYEPFCVKEDKIFFIETKKNFQREPLKSMGDHLRMSQKRFTSLINPLELNKGQTTNKWLARWQLILSTSRPAVEFQPENIFLGLDDIYGNDSLKDESIMTDGCGYINLTALRQIAAVTNSICPLVVLVQGRIAGAKGLWILHPDPQHRADSEPPKVWIRKSQKKINLLDKEKWDRSLRIFDLVRLPRLTVPSGVNMQTILNMSNNGIKDDVFVNLMKDGLNKEIEALTEWEGENACVTLARAVEEAGGIMASRRARGAGAEARLYSYVRDESDEDEDSGTNGGLVERDNISGCAPSLFESAHDMLLAGFTPLQNEVLREKLRHILKETTKSYLEKFHIPVVRSAEAFIAPDPHNVLEEGEIYFRCSTPVGDPTVCIDPHTFLGPVLVSRNPTRVASDVRKVMAVSHDQLLSYTDVILFSTKGKRSLASYLGGGDYDGDTVTIIAEPSLVDAFHNSPHIPEPPAIRESFEQDVEKVSTFLAEVEALTTESKYHELKKRILHGLSDGKVGQYSKMHDNATYELGYNDPTTIRLAYMFTTCLDSVKSGLRIKSEVFKKDSSRWNVDRPECMQTAEEAARNQSKPGVGRQLHRPRKLGPFVLETLRKCAKELGDKALCDFEKLSDQAESSSSGLRPKPDGDLAMPYNEWKEYTNRWRDKCNFPGPSEDLGKLESFVSSLCDEYISVVGPLFGNKSPRKNSWNETSSKAKSVTHINYDFSRRFEEGFCESSLSIPPRQVMEIKASYAHVYGMKSKLGRAFSFAVAGDTLCALKIERKGGASISRECRDYTLISNSLLKLIRDE